MRNVPKCIPAVVRVLVNAEHVGLQQSMLKGGLPPVPRDILGDAYALRRIAMTLHRWHELESGASNGAVERDEETSKTYWYNAMTGDRYPTADRETGALNRLAAIMEHYPTLSYYVQGDPRGAALYILRPGDVPEGGDPSAYYSRGVAAYK